MRWSYLILPALGAALLAWPLVNEDTGSTCSALETQTARQLVADFSTDPGATPGATTFASLLAQGVTTLARGQIAVTFVKKHYPNLPPFLGCAFAYYAHTWRPVTRADFNDTPAVAAAPPAPLPTEAPPAPPVSPEAPTNTGDQGRFDALLRNLAAADNPPSPDAPPPAPAPHTDQPFTASEVDMVRDQISRCWNVSAEARHARNPLIIEIRVVVNPDGNVQQATIVAQQRAKADPFFRAVAETARLAFLDPKCRPLHLPPNKYKAWRDMVVDFSPNSSAPPVQMYEKGLADRTAWENWFAVKYATEIRAGV